MHKLNRNLINRVCNNFYNWRYGSTKLARTTGLSTSTSSKFSYFTSKTSLSSFQSSVGLKTIENDVKVLLEEFPEPKSIFLRVINEAYLVFMSADIKPNMNVQQIGFGKSDQKLWYATLSMNWPERNQVEGIASKKSEAEKIAYLYACQKIKEFGYLNDENMPQLPEKNLSFEDQQIKCAKSDLGNIFQVIWTKFGNRELIPNYKTFEKKTVFGNSMNWKSEVYLKYPKDISFEGVAVRRVDAENIAALKALHWLYENGVINKHMRPLLYSKEEEKKMRDNQKLPCPLYIPSELQKKMASTLSIFENLEIMESDVHGNIEKEHSLNDHTLLRNTDLRDVFTERPYHELSEKDATKRNEHMYQKQAFHQQSYDLETKKIRYLRSLLPIMKRREEILKLINENQVVVLSGDTGCGKTTQVPQYILESFVAKKKGSDCNIVVTQPRRISAISIAERVATERGEQVGESVGHQVRLNKKLPQGNGAILFCSTGILLRKLCFNPNLEGVSHIIVDEVHERNIQIDFLLILLKKLIQTNTKIKLILMSASFNSNLFSQYFGNNSPVVHVPGFVHPVKEYFLEDIESIMNFDYKISHRKIDIDLIANVIDYIDTTQPPGAILCFLPGWSEMKAVAEIVHSIFSDKSKYFVCMVHSRLPHVEQKRIFMNPPRGVRKIVLATNIAETSITINDVVYVVNSGLHKGTSFDVVKGTAALGTEWITKANVRQRRGRAGRVQPGVCYHLFSRKKLIEMDEYPTPEMLRIPLENVILDCKLYCPDVKAEDFLSMALQPPSLSSIQLGIQELRLLGVFDQEENLTILGKTIIHFATHPRLSKALVLATFLRCLDPILTISALLTISQDPFSNTLEQKGEIKKIKNKYSNSTFSDHLALYEIYRQWESRDKENTAEEFVEKNLLDVESLKFVSQLKGLFAEHLYEAGLIEHADSFLNSQDVCNQNSENITAVLAALTSAFYPNIIKLIQGEVAHSKLNKDAIVYSTLRGQKALIQKESVASKVNNLPSPWFIYFSALHSEARRLMMTPAVSSVPGINLLLFAGEELHLETLPDSSQDSKDEVLKTKLLVDGSNKLSLSCSQNEAKLISEWRNLINKLFQFYLKTEGKYNTNEDTQFNTHLKTEFFPVLRETLEIPQVPFTPGKKYVFINGELSSEDL